MKSPLILIFSILLNLVYGQPILIKGVITDTLQQPLAFISVANLQTQIGFYSLDNGYFEIDCDKNDTLVFSGMGYQTDTIIAHQIKPHVILTPNAYSIDEITISSQKTTSIIGRYAHSNSSFSSSEAGFELVSMFTYDTVHQYKSIKKICIQKRKGGYGRLNLHIYAVGKDGFPDVSRELTSSDLVIDGSLFKKELIFDLTSNPVILPPSGQIFISIQYLDSYHFFDKNNGPIYLKTIKSSNQQGFSRKLFVTKDWYTDHLFQFNVKLEVQN